MLLKTAKNAGDFWSDLICCVTVARITLKSLASLRITVILDVPPCRPLLRPLLTRITLKSQLKSQLSKPDTDDQKHSQTHPTCALTAPIGIPFYPIASCRIVAHVTRGFRERSQWAGQGSRIAAHAALGVRARRPWLQMCRGCAPGPV